MLNLLFVVSLRDLINNWFKVLENRMLLDKTFKWSIYLMISSITSKKKTMNSLMIKILKTRNSDKLTINDINLSSNEVQLNYLLNTLVIWTIFFEFSGYRQYFQAMKVKKPQLYSVHRLKRKNRIKLEECFLVLFLVNWF